MWERGRFERPPPRAAHGGIKAQSRHGDFGQSWWAKRWQAVLESFRIGGRLARGRIYARQGQVLSIEIVEGVVRSQVQGSRPRPYDVTIRVKELTEKQWHEVLSVLSGQALFVAKLLAGQMPQDIEQVFTQARLSLFPHKRGDLHTNCSCPDEANPCKHIAAVYYLLGEEFDRDPFLLFRLRGLDREKLLRQLGSQAGKPASREEPAALPREALPREPAVFWTSPPLADDFFGEVQAPPVSAGLVRRLGKFPFWRGERPLVEVVEPTYVAASALGVSAFLGERTEGKKHP